MRESVLSIEKPLLAHDIKVHKIRNQSHNEQARDKAKDQNSKPNNPSNEHSFLQKFLKTAKLWSRIFDSRPSTHRAIMDLLGADIPTVLGGLRNIYSFFESLYEASMSFVMVFAAPSITKLIGTLVGKFLLPKSEQKDILNHLLFHRAELHDDNQFKQAIERIKEEEVADQNRISELYTELNKENKAQEFKSHAQRIKNYCNNLLAKNSDIESLRKKILKLKNLTMLGESFIEGGIWGSFGIGLRLFRKYILKQNSFTGTNSYTNEKQRKRLGDDQGIGFKELLGAAVGMLISPLVNSLSLYLTKDRAKVKQSKLLSFIDSQLDMSHALYPKLGLMFTFLTLPKYSSVFLTAQGRNELYERVFKFLAIVPLWWLGQKLTNGPLAAYRDQQISKKYKIKPGLLVDRPLVRKPGLLGFLNHIFPEARKYFDLEKKLKAYNNPKLKDEVLNKHSRTAYEGLALHSLIMFLAISGAQFLTKLRVKKRL